MKIFYALVCCSSLFAATVTLSVEETISTNSQNYQPQLVFNTAGNGVAVWSRTQVTQATTQLQPALVLASRYTATTSSWETTPTQIGTGNAPVVGIDNNDTITVIFVNNSQIQAVRYDATAATPAWDATATALTTENTNIEPFIAVNPNGIAAVVWTSTETGSLLTSIQLAAYDGTSWSTPVTLNAPSTTDFVGTAQVAIDNTPIGTGVNGQVVWQSTSQTAENAGIINTIPFIITQ